jgi:hypothetical protein
MGERRYSSYSLLTSALDGVIVRVTPLPRFTPEERTPDTHWTGDWVDPRAGLGTEVRGKILLPLPGIEPRSLGLPVRSQTLYRLSYPALMHRSIPEIRPLYSYTGQHPYIERNVNPRLQREDT